MFTQYRCVMILQAGNILVRVTAGPGVCYGVNVSLI